MGNARSHGSLLGNKALCYRLVPIFLRPSGGYPPHSERIGSSRATRLTLQDLLRPRVTKLGYLYDMGDYGNTNSP